MFRGDNMAARGRYSGGGEGGRWVISWLGVWRGRARGRGWRRERVGGVGEAARGRRAVAGRRALRGAGRGHRQGKCKGGTKRSKGRREQFHKRVLSVGLQRYAIAVWTTAAPRGDERGDAPQSGRPLTAHPPPWTAAPHLERHRSFLPFSPRLPSPSAAWHPFPKKLFPGCSSRPVRARLVSHCTLSWGLTRRPLPGRRSRSHPPWAAGRGSSSDHLGLWRSPAVPGGR